MWALFVCLNFVRALRYCCKDNTAFYASLGTKQLLARWRCQYPRITSFFNTLSIALASLITSFGSLYDVHLYPSDDFVLSLDSFRSSGLDILLMSTLMSWACEKLCHRGIRWYLLVLLYDFTMFSFITLILISTRPHIGLPTNSQT